MYAVSAQSAPFRRHRLCAICPWASGLHLFPKVPHSDWTNTYASGRWLSKILDDNFQGTISTTSAGFRTWTFWVCPVTTQIACRLHLWYISQSPERPAKSTTLQVTHDGSPVQSAASMWECVLHSRHYGLPSCTFGNKWLQAKAQSSSSVVGMTASKRQNWADKIFRPRGEGNVCASKMRPQVTGWFTCQVCLASGHDSAMLLQAASDRSSWAGDGGMVMWSPPRRCAASQYIRCTSVEPSHKNVCTGPNVSCSSPRRWSMQLYLG